MEIVVDGKTGWGVFDPGRTLGVLFDEIRKQAVDRKRAVVSLVLDGEDLSPDRQRAVATHPLDPYRILEVRTIDPHELSISALAGLHPHVANLERLHAEGASLVRAGQLGKGGELLGQCIDGWDVLVRAVRDVASLSEADFRTMTSGGEVIENKIRKLQQSLVRYRMAFEARDMIRTADIADPDLRGQLADWRGILEALSAHLERRSGPSR